MSVLKTIVAVKNIKGTSFVGVRSYENSNGGNFKPNFFSWNFI